MATANPSIPKLISRQVVEAQIDLLINMLDALDSDPDLEPSLGWLTGNQYPENHPQDALAANANAGDDREEGGDDLEPDVDSEPSLGWTSTTNQTATSWHANNLGMTDMEQGVGPVRKARPASKTGNRVVVGWRAEVLR